MNLRRSIALALVSCVSSIAPAAAQTGQEMAMAEALFQEGRELMDAGKLDEACPKFAKSMDLDPKLGTLLNLAVCHQKQGKTATAWAEFTTARSRAEREGRGERADFARQRIQELEAKLSYVVVTSSGSVSITLDGKALAPAMLDTKLPLDPGKHVIEATAPGKKPYRREIEVPVGPAEIAVAIPLLEEDDAMPSPEPAVEPVPAPLLPAPAPTPAPVREDDAAPTILMGVGFGVAGVGLLVGAITGGITIAKGSDLKEACATGCPPDQSGELDTANTLANVSNVMFAVAAVGAVIGIVGVALDADDDEVALELDLRLSPTGVGLAGSF